MSPTIHQPSGHHEGRRGGTLPSLSGDQAPDQAHAHAVCSTESPAPAASARALSANKSPRPSQLRWQSCYVIGGSPRKAVPVRGGTTRVGVGVGEGHSYETEVIPN